MSHFIPNQMTLPKQLKVENIKVPLLFYFMTSFRMRKMAVHVYELKVCYNL